MLVNIYAIAWLYNIVLDKVNKFAWKDGDFLDLFSTTPCGAQNRWSSRLSSSVLGQLISSLAGLAG